MGKRILSMVLTFMLVITMLPLTSLPVYADSSSGGETLDNMNALQALGIDTDEIPEGFDEESEDNPYGKDKITINPVSELFVSEQSSGVDGYKMSRSLRGHEGILTGTTNDFYSNTKNSTNNLITLDSNKDISTEYYKSYKAFKAVSGNFDGKGMKGQVVTVAAGANANDGGLYMYFTDPVSGEMSIEPIELMGTGDIIGNYDRYDYEDLTTQFYQLQNYLQISTGDYDGDGIDEVAVYIPEQGNSQVAIYKLQTTDSNPGNLYLNTSKWSIAWTYAFNESPYVSNMVSITSGDFNRDGTDDIALTWGTYYGPNYNTPCKAAVLYGSKLGNMLQKSKTFDLIYANSQIVRAAFTYGDINGDGTDELILGGQLVSDINKKVFSNRVIMMYNYNGDEDRFVLTYSENFEIIDEDQQGEDNKYFSSPACVANITTVKMNGVGKAAHIYLDSVIFEYGNDGLKIVLELDEADEMKDTRPFSTYNDYAEYGVLAADFDGDGMETLQVMQYFFPQTLTYKDFWWWFFGTFDPVNIPGNLFMVSIYASGEDLIYNRKDCGEYLTTYYTNVNTDDDTTFIEYTGNHYIAYSDPKVLAVLASPPYFEDIAIQEDSGNYLEGSTEYSSTGGYSTGQTTSHTLSVGTYISFEQEFSVFGIKVASFETEFAYSHGFTWETEKTSTLEQSVTYGTATGEDAVAFYSIPVEVYVYKSYYPEINPDGTATMKEQTMTVNIPHTAAVVTMPLKTYESIAADYEELPRISGRVLNHTLGKPSTYPFSVSEFAAQLGSGIYTGANSAIVFGGDWAAVNYGGLGYVTQEIAMSNESSSSFTNSESIDFKIRGGAGGLVVGITAGYEYGYGTTTVTTNGNSFSGTVNNLPTGAEDYYYAWKLFAYYYSDGMNAFPVVSYLVKDVKTPPELPKDFAQDTSRTTHNQICLTWSYSGGAAGFQIYRYYEFPDGSGSYELGPVVKASDFEYFDEETNIKYYSFIDGGDGEEALYPYTEYKYQIQVIGTAQPTDSILSPVLVARTKPDVGYPDIALSTRLLEVYPDVSKSVTAYIRNSEDYSQGAKFQWQKMLDGQWKDLSGYTKATLTISNAGLDTAGEYRCRINVIYDAYYISAYSDTVTVKYAKRNSNVQEIMITDTVTGHTLRTEVSHPHTDIQTPPTGTVTFEIKNANYYKSYTTDIKIIGSKGIAEVDITKLPDGVYEIRAFYSGSRIFKASESEPLPYLSGSNEGYLLQVGESIIYGDEIDYDMNRVTKDDSGKTEITPIETGITYKVFKLSSTYEFLIYDIFGLKISIPVWRTVWMEQSGWIDGDIITAKEAGSFTLCAYDGDTELAYKNINVAKKDLTIKAKDISATAKTDDAKHPTAKDVLVITTGSLMDWDKGPDDDILQNLNLFVSAFRAGIQIEVDSSTEPGEYTIVGMPPEEFNKTLSNYNITFIEGKYILTGETFPVKGEAAKLLGNKVGTLEVISPSNHQHWTTQYQNGTQIRFQAVPDRGYAVSGWYIKNNETGVFELEEDEDGNPVLTNGLNYLMKSVPLDIRVEFSVKGNTLEYKVLYDKTEAGEVVCVSSDSLTSGAVVIEGASYDFMAVPKEGYHFVEWQKYVLGGGTTKPAGTVDDEGMHLVNIEMGTMSIILYAVFERDSYEITLGDHLEAWYMDNIDNDTSTGDENGDELVIANSKDIIKGDKEVTVKPSPGYMVKENADWYKDGVLIEGNTGLSQYEFVMLKDTSIDVETVNIPVKIDFDILDAGGEENTVVIEINDTVVTDPDELNKIPGGSKVELKAVPAYGYLFDKWIVNGNDDVESGKTLIIGTIGSDMTVVAVFKDNELYTINVSYDTEGDHGTLSYSLNEVSFIGIESPAEIDVFEGDNVVLRANVDSDFMVGKWIINGTEYQTTVRTWNLTNIDEDYDIWVKFVPMAYYTVEYSVGGEGGGEISATTDGVPFESGNPNIGGGTEIVFTAAPDDGKMVDYWLTDDDEAVNTYDTTYVGKVYTIDGLSRNTKAEVFFTDVVEYIVDTATTNSAISVTFDPEDQEEFTDVRAGTMAIFNIRPVKGYKVVEYGVTGNTGEHNGFDEVVENDDATYTCIIYEINDDIEVYAVSEKLYSIYAQSEKGGNVVISTDKAVEGEEITISAYPSKNYIFVSWEATYIDNTSGSAVKVVDLEDEAVSTTKFTMPNGDVTVRAKFKYKAPDNYNGGGGGAVKSIVYMITAKAGSGGNISPSFDEVEAGENATFTITAHEGFEISDVLVNGKSVGPVSSYTFKDLQKDSNIEALFIEKIAEPTKFTDVNDDDWFAEAVKFVVSLGLFKGTSEDTFSPYASMTRGMFVTVLGRLYEYMNDISLSAPEGSSFSDVSPDQYYAAAVKWASENNIISGYENGQFKPDEPITREQMVAVMYRFAAYAGLDISITTDIDKFEDSEDVSSWAIYAVKWAVGSGILGGRTDGTLDPQGPVQRCEVAAILLRFFENFIE